MAGTGSGDLYAAASEFLDACLLALADTPGGPPSQAYVSPGPPVIDCVPQLTVHISGPAVADTMPLQPVLGPGHRTTVAGEVNLVSLVATIARCAPLVGDEADAPPSPAEQDAASQEMMADVWAILAHIRKRKRIGTLFAPVEKPFFIDSPTPLNQQGGAGGWQITVRVALDGYNPTLLAEES